jgi:DNA-binding transcriptional MerR regulator
VRSPPPAEGWPIVELAKLSGLSAATIKNYVKLGLLAPVVFRGTATRYPRGHLLRLLAIRHLKLDGYFDLKAIRRKLDTWGPVELEAWVLQRGARPKVINALSASGTRSAPAPLAAPAPALAAPPTLAPALVPGALVPGTPLPESQPQTNTPPLVNTEDWQRVVFLPGLELQVQKGAGPAVQRMAERLCAAFIAASEVER